MTLKPFFTSLALTFGLGFASPASVPVGNVTSLAVSSEPTLGLTAVYSGSVLFLKVGEISLQTRLADGRYEAQSMIEAAGLLSLFTDFEIRSEVEGELDARGEMSPQRYAHIERTGDKVRSVEVLFDDGVAQSSAEPPFGSWGQPPASREERQGTLDPMTALFSLSDAVARNPGQGCEGSIPVFDGKARYNLNLESDGRRNVRTPGWRGEALICQAWYEPISGYDPEDYPSEDELRHPLTIWLAPIHEGEYYLPVRLHTRAGFGGVTIEAVDIAIE